MDGMEVNLSRAIDFFYPSSSSLELVYFEAIANAIDAGANNIQISIAVDSYSKPESLTIVISDNGVGFTNDRYRKFTKLLETEEEDHKGLGRLVFLKYFKEVYIESIFEKQIRKFTFKKNFEKNNFTLSPAPDATYTGSRLAFSGYLKKKLYSYDFLKPVSKRPTAFFPIFLAECLRIFLRGRFVYAGNGDAERLFPQDSGPVIRRPRRTDPDARPRSGRASP